MNATLIYDTERSQKGHKKPYASINLKPVITLSSKQTTQYRL